VSERSAEPDGEATPDPTRSETRLRAPADVPLPRASRPSVRPSAFGPPRSSAPPAAAREGELETEEPLMLVALRKQAPANDAEAEPTHDELAAQEPRPGAEEHRPQRTPHFAAALRSLRPAFGGTTPGRRPVVSIALFCGMLALSAFTLLRYALPERDGSALTGARSAQPSDARRTPRDTGALAAQPRAATNANEQQVEQAAASPDPAQARAELILSLRQQGDRALIRGSLREAEQAFTGIFQVEPENARAAFGLAQVRRAQGDLSGAEGWVQQAIRKRPRRAVYHAFYAEILTELGREDDAVEERLRAAGAETQPD
jgi:tetratricopeptide (TPR) repeat protein